MGYPMTYRRVINRNHLAEGGYDAAATYTGGTTLDYSPDILKALIESQRDMLVKASNDRRFLLGDLRRLETDTVDESAICRDIAFRTGVDLDDVAAVLKAWMAL